MSPSEMLLNELANTTDELRLSDFELVSTDQSATAYQMLEDDEAQLSILWEPDVSAAGDGHTPLQQRRRARLDRRHHRGQRPAHRA